MKLSQALQEKKMDLRLRDKSLVDGKITKEELNTYLESLPDESSKMTYTEDIIQKSSSFHD